YKVKVDISDQQMRLDHGADCHRDSVWVNDRRAADKPLAALKSAQLTICAPNSVLFSDGGEQAVVSVETFHRFAGKAPSRRSAWDNQKLGACQRRQRWKDRVPQVLANENCHAAQASVKDA